MPRWMRRRLTYANVIATLALFLALNVGAYAAIKIPPNSIGPAQLKNKAVTPKKVSPAAIKLFRGKNGQKGPVGAKGLPGAGGPGGHSRRVRRGQRRARHDGRLADEERRGREHHASSLRRVLLRAPVHSEERRSSTGRTSWRRNDTLATVYVRRAGDGPPDDCAGNDNVRVRTLDLDGNPSTVSAMYSPALRDHDFFIWFE